MLRRIKHRICGVYDIGYSYTLDTYVLAVNVLALWRYTRYYSITKEEYDLHRTAKGLKELDNIAWQCISAENQHKRFLCSALSNDQKNLWKMTASALLSSQTEQRSLSEIITATGQMPCLQFCVSCKPKATFPCTCRMTFDL